MGVGGIEVHVGWVVAVISLGYDCGWVEVGPVGSCCRCTIQHLTPLAAMTCFQQTGYQGGNTDLDTNYGAKLASTRC